VTRSITYKANLFRDHSIYILSDVNFICAGKTCNNFCTESYNTQCICEHYSSVYSSERRYKSSSVTSRVFVAALLEC